MKNEKTKDSILMVIWQNFWHIWTNILEIYFRVQKKYWMKICNSLATVKSFISLLEKITKKILHEIDTISGKIALKCKGWLLHCLQLTVSKRERIMQTLSLFVHLKLSANLFNMFTPKKMCTKFLLCMSVKNVNKNSAVDLWIKWYT